jgi:hypothetical protein
MALTYRQKTLAVQKGLRQARKVLRNWDTQVEKLQREMSRLVNRKTLIGPDSLKTMYSLYDSIRKGLSGVERAILDATAVAEY